MKKIIILLLLTVLFGWLPVKAQPSNGMQLNRSYLITPLDGHGFGVTNSSGLVGNSTASVSASNATFQALSVGGVSGNSVFSGWFYGTNNIIYVDSNGNDTNNGATYYTPVPRWDEAVTLATNPANAIIIAPGTVYWTNHPSLSNNITVNAWGTHLIATNSHSSDVFSINGGFNAFNGGLYDFYVGNILASEGIGFGSHASTNIWFGGEFIGAIDNLLYLLGHAVANGQSDTFINWTFVSGFDLIAEGYIAGSATTTLPYREYDQCRFFSVNVGQGQQAFSRLNIQTPGSSIFNNCYFYLTNGTGGNYITIGSGNSSIFNLYLNGGSIQQVGQSALIANGANVTVFINGTQGLNFNNVVVTNGATVIWGTNSFGGLSGGSLSASLIGASSLSSLLSVVTNQATSGTNSAQYAFSANSATTNQASAGTNSAQYAFSATSATTNQASAGTNSAAITYTGSLVATNSVSTLALTVTNVTIGGPANFIANSDVAYSRYAVTTLANGNNADIATGTNVFVELSGNTGPVYLAGFTAQPNRDGAYRIILYRNSYPATIGNLSGIDSTAANRIQTMTGSDRYSAGPFAATLVYSVAASQWMLTSFESISTTSTNAYVAIVGGEATNLTASSSDGTTPALTANGPVSAASGSFIVSQNGDIIYNGILTNAASHFNVDPSGAITAAYGEFKVDASGAITASAGNFTVDPSGTVVVNGSLTNHGSYGDSLNLPGTPGQILTSTGTATAWSNAPAGGGSFPSFALTNGQTTAVNLTNDNNGINSSNSVLSGAVTMPSTLTLDGLLVTNYWFYSTAIPGIDAVAPVLAMPGVMLGANGAQYLDFYGGSTLRWVQPGGLFDWESNAAPGLVIHSATNQAPAWLGSFNTLNWQIFQSPSGALHITNTLTGSGFDLGTNGYSKHVSPFGTTFEIQPTNSGTTLVVSGGNAASSFFISTNGSVNTTGTNCAAYGVVTNAPVNANDVARLTEVRSAMNTSTNFAILTTNSIAAGAIQGTIANGNLPSSALTTQMTTATNFANNVVTSAMTNNDTRVENFATNTSFSANGQSLTIQPTNNGVRLIVSGGGATTNFFGTNWTSIGGIQFSNENNGNLDIVANNQPIGTGTGLIFQSTALDLYGGDGQLDFQCVQSGNNGTFRPLNFNSNPANQISTANANTGNFGTLLATNNFITTGTNATASMTSVGWTNNLGTTARIFDFTCASAFLTNRTSGQAFSFGSITAPTYLEMQTNEAIVGGTCAAAAIWAK